MLLEFTPNEKQRAALIRWNDEITKEICFGGAKYGGKSFLGANCIFHDALVYPETFYFIAREKLNAIRKYTIPTINEAFKNWNIRLDDYMGYDGKDNFFECYNGSRVYFLECAYIPTDPLYERFGSMEFTRGWIEEGGEIHALAKENLAISIGRRNNHIYKLKPKLLITCNPKKNWLYNEFYKPSVRKQLPKERAFIVSLPTDNIYGDQDYIKNTLAKMRDPVMRQRLYLGNWEYDDDPTSLMDYDSIADCFSNDFIEPDRKYISADIARYGPDKTIIMFWSGWRCEQIQEHPKTSVTESAQLIDKLAKANGVPRHQIIVDEDGIGGGVKDILNCIGFVANSSPIPIEGEKENFRNLRSQCYFKLADHVNAGEVFIDEPSEEIKENIIQEMEAVKQKSVDNDQKKEVISRADMQAQIGRSPDYVSTLMMRVHFDLKPKYKAVRSIAV